MLLLVCGVGTLTAIAGIIVGIIAITKRSNKRRAIVGLCLSALTLLLGLIAGVLIYNWYHSKNLGECFDPSLYPSQEAAQRCVEEKLGGTQPENAV
ncbi:hypothetical protein Psi02_53840 [Planotetraspora silvatica]|uniref:DUF4190 domain-containing protein n=1 Tax=Planotetraspora silvatica TaxID=234614 RepID=A0A8J3V2U5_9ACTN|nr:hypothetical protein Psi02_53840 [Planotetraspora silvatica]